MSKRLQVLLEDSEMREIRAVARRNRMTVAAWVRQAIRAARCEEPGSDPRQKLAVIRSAVAHSFPAGDLDSMLEEIERGYQGREKDRADLLVRSRV